MLEDFRLNIFLTVARTGSFTKAAELLDISQPAVSQNVAEIEKSLGVRLFNRGRHEMSLTSEGRLFLSYAEKICYWYEAADAVFGKTVKRSRMESIRVAATPDLGSSFLPDILHSFAVVNPDLSFSMSDCCGDVEADLIVKSVPVTDELSWEREANLICQSHVCAAVSSVSRMAFSQASSLAEINGAWFACWDGVAPGVLQPDVISRVRFTSPSVEAVKRYVLQSSSAVAVLPYHSVCRELGSGEMRLVPLSRPLCRMMISFIPSAAFSRVPLCNLIKQKIVESIG